MKINKNSKWLNDSNFLEEGEYIIEKQPKYKYEIKIHHDYSKEKEMNKFKSKTPDKIKFVHKYSNKKNSYKNHFIKNIRPENIAQLHFFVIIIKNLIILNITIMIVKKNYIILLKNVLKKLKMKKNQI